MVPLALVVVEIGSDQMGQKTDRQLHSSDEKVWHIDVQAA